MYFNHCNTLDELKKEYRRLVMLHHPDRGGDTATMAAINGEYESRFAVLKDKHNATADEYHKTTEAPNEFIDIISALIRIPGILVELCGCWIWISGETREAKEQLKACGCRWSSSKKMWYWHHAEDGARWSRGKSSIGEIRRKYGSQAYSSNGFVVALEA